MGRVSYFIGGSLTRCHDAAIILDGEDPMAEVAQSVIQTIATDIEVSLDDVKIHLAALLDPENWEEDWQAVGVDDPYDFIAGLVGEDAEATAT